MKKRLPLLILPILVSTSCARDRDLDRITPQVKTEDSPNIVKVLNRVKCHETDQRNCNQNMVNAIWQLCLDSGYITSMHSNQVISSREITELVSGSARVMEIVQSPIERTDEYGLVTIESQNKTELVTRSSKGYCIGSEYITQ